MCFRRCSINGVVYYENKGVLYKLPECGTTIKAQRVDTWTVSGVIASFVFNLSCSIFLPIQFIIH